MKKITINRELCTQCHICEETCSLTYFKVKDINKSALRINDKDINICTQCGKCIDVCPVEAIYKDNKGVIRIKKDICVGCFMCVGFCPNFAMFQHDDYIEPFKCVACGLCVKKCPTGAIAIEEK